MRDEFMIVRQGKQFVLYAGLLDEAHSLGLSRVDTELLQTPHGTNANTAIVKASVRMNDDEVFTGIGDASPENVGRNIAPHIIRMAETRAKARALRDAVNVSALVFEEFSEVAGGQESPRNTANRDSSNRPSPDQPNARQPASQVEPTQVASAQSNTAARKARKGQVDLLKTLAVEIRGEDGIEKMEEHIGKRLSDLSSPEADGWIERLTPSEQGG